MTNVITMTDEELQDIFCFMLLKESYSLDDKSIFGFLGFEWIKNEMTRRGKLFSLKKEEQQQECKCAKCSCGEEEKRKKNQYEEAYESLHNDLSKIYLDLIKKMME